MGKLLLTGVDGNLGAEAAKILLELEDKDNLIFCGYNPESLKQYADMGVETRVTNFNHADGLAEAFQGAERLALISMPFVGPKRQAAHRNAVDAAKAAGVKQIVHIYTENYIKAAGLDYIFMRNSQYAEAMVTNYFTFVHMDGVLKNSQGDGLMAYISRKDCAKALAYALHRGDEYSRRMRKTIRCLTPWAFRVQRTACSSRAVKRRFLPMVWLPLHRRSARAKWRSIPTISKSSRDRSPSPCSICSNTPTNSRWATATPRTRNSFALTVSL